jgi:nucleotide-binding universal stress UspA family protein
LVLAELLARILAADVTRVRVEARADSPAGGDLSTQAASDPGIEVHAGDSPARGLHELADSRGAAMVVVGSSHRAGLGRIFPGTVATRLLQGGPCPVAIAPRGYADDSPGEPRVIGVAFDASPESREALDFAATLGGRVAAALRVITAYQGTPPEGNPTLEGMRTPYEQLQDDLKAAVERLPAELRAEPRFLLGEPAHVLAAESELRMDLLVMGSRGYGPLRSVLLGSVSEVVVESASCPVILIPRGARAGSGEG